jgi:hypothetical protein
MSLAWPQSGEYNVSAYQMSAMPYVTSSIINNGEVHRYNFPYVTRFIDVVNRGSAGNTIALGFTENGVLSTGNYVTLDSGASVKEEVRTTALFISCSSGTNVKYQILCGLTTIPAKNFLVLSASNGHPGIG